VGSVIREVYTVKRREGRSQQKLAAPREFGREARVQNTFQWTGRKLKRPAYVLTVRKTGEGVSPRRGKYRHRFKKAVHSWRGRTWEQKGSRMKERCKTGKEVGTKRAKRAGDRLMRSCPSNVKKRISIWGKGGYCVSINFPGGLQKGGVNWKSSQYGLVKEGIAKKHSVQRGIKWRHLVATARPMGGPKVKLRRKGEGGVSGALGTRGS